MFIRPWAGLAGLQPPSGIDGVDGSAYIAGKSAKAPRDRALLQMMYGYVAWPGRRALRTHEHSYARTVDGPSFLYIITQDPFQVKNLVEDSGARALLADMDKRLSTLMNETGDSWEYKATTGDYEQ